MRICTNQRHKTPLPSYHRGDVEKEQQYGYYRSPSKH